MTKPKMMECKRMSLDEFTELYNTHSRMLLGKSANNSALTRHYNAYVTLMKLNNGKWGTPVFDGTADNQDDLNWYLPPSQP